MGLFKKNPFGHILIVKKWLIRIFGLLTHRRFRGFNELQIEGSKTTAEKIMMTGEPVNISNIEKKIKDGFDNVADVAKNVNRFGWNAAKNVSDSVTNAAKNVDVKKGANSIKSSSRTFFDAIGDIFIFFFKIFAKFIGVLLIIIGASTLIGLIIGLFSLGVADIIHIPGLDMVEIANAGETPLWLVSLLTFFAVDTDDGDWPSKNIYIRNVEILD